MKLSEPVNIMLDCCIPDKKKLMGELSKLSPGDRLKVKIDNCITSKALVESYLKHKWYRIIDTVEADDASILDIVVTKDL